jgi:hypothetical protein
MTQFSISGVEGERCRAAVTGAPGQQAHLESDLTYERIADRRSRHGKPSSRRITQPLVKKLSELLGIAAKREVHGGGSRARAEPGAPSDVEPR